jgi:hypothetical protein
MKEAPISFEHKGKHYSGFFSQVQGSANSLVFYLNIDGYYSGRLRCSEFDNSWKFDSTPKHDFSELADFFEYFIFAWYQ